MTIIKDERGLSLIELLGALVIFGLVSVLLSSVLFSISKASTVQSQQVEFQQTANMMILQIEKISKTAEIYQKANYWGKFTDTSAWKETHIVKIVEGDEKESDENTPGNSGVNPIYLTDINDAENAKTTSYQIKEKDLKIKILQQKNEHEERKTTYGTTSYRDTFTIQTSGIILFYKDTITFSDYYTAAGVWEMDKLLADNKEKIHYSRKFVSNYRDDDKAKGAVPGNGRW